MANKKKDAAKEYSANWGGKRAGQGRPKGTTGAYKAPEDVKSESIYVKCTKAEKLQIAENAELAGLSVSKYILSKVL